MKAERNVLLSGLGYYRLSQERRKLLGIVALASLAAHVLGLAIFGSWVVLQHMRDERTVFTAPPPLKTYQPRQIEHQVRVQQRQRSSSRPQITPRMVSARPSELSLPEIRVDPQVVRTTFQPQFRAVSGAGLGAGLGTGLGLGGFGQGVSQFDFFGIRGRGSRIAIILDVSISMAEESEELGVTARGVAGFARVKARLGEVIDALSPNTMFNVIVYASTASAWEDEMQPATEPNKQRARRFIEPFNSRVSWDAVGHDSGITRMDAGLGDYATGGTTRFDLALSLAFKNRPDTILVICDGDVWTTRPNTEAEYAAHAAAMERWRERQAAASEQRADTREVRTRTERVWVPGRPARGPVIRERGGQREATAATEGRWVEREVPVGPGASGPRVPPRPSLPRAVWSMDDYERHIQKLHEEFMAPSGRPMPVIHVIGFRSGREDSGFLRDLARRFDGNFRRVVR